MKSSSENSYGKYQILETIGTTNVAETFKARLDGIGGFHRLFAIKRILPEFSENEVFVSRLVDEAKKAGLLSHSNIAQILDLGSIDDTCYIAMEYVHGLNLHRVLSTCREKGISLPVPHAVFTAIEVLKGLDYAHQRKVLRSGKPIPLNLVHQNISPPNIIIGYQGEVKITDFGMDRATQVVGPHSESYGDYKSPEQITKSRFDLRSDIFATGCLLYEMLCGSHPFRKENPEATRAAILNHKMTPPTVANPDVPYSLEVVLQRALAADPDHRFQSAAAFKEALEGFFHDAGFIFSQSTLASFLKGLYPQEKAKSTAVITGYADSETIPYTADMDLLDTEEDEHPTSSQNPTEVNFGAAIKSLVRGDGDTQLRNKNSPDEVFHTSASFGPSLNEGEDATLILRANDSDNFDSAARNKVARENYGKSSDTAPIIKKAKKNEDETQVLRQSDKLSADTTSKLSPGLGDPKSTNKSQDDVDGYIALQTPLPNHYNDSMGDDTGPIPLPSHGRFFLLLLSSIWLGLGLLLGFLAGSWHTESKFQGEPIIEPAQLPLAATLRIIGPQGTSVVVMDPDGSDRSFTIPVSGLVEISLSPNTQSIVKIESEGFAPIESSYTLSENEIRVVQLDAESLQTNER
tara:strand:+ start:533 stop:2431 length:1899 start_codon:yes stop_codon:yes gene_type:complete